MNELQLVFRQEPGLVSIDNFERLRAALNVYLERYKGVVYTEAMLSQANQDKKELSRLRKELDERRKDVKREYLAPYLEFEAKIKELLALIDEPLNEIKAFSAGVKSREKDAKRAEIEAYYRANSAALGAMADKVWESPAFFDDKWLNKSVSVKTWRDAVKAKIQAATSDLSAIQAAGGAHSGALVAHYLERLDTDGLAEYRAQLDEMDEASKAEISVPAPEDARMGYKVLKLTGTAPQLLQAMELLELAGIEVEELEDGMPQSFKELAAPDFDSFVAFDIETTGTFGAANGDAPAEITEIGAGKVINGEIVARFDELANPRRKIVPRIQRMTGITNETVADKPDIAEVIRQFADFAHGFVLVGHNIKSHDLPYIDCAAKRAGVTMDNAFFDTYRYAKTLKERQGWDNVKLEYLAERFGVEQSTAHRAWCDAEANAGVFFKLKAL